MKVEELLKKKWIKLDNYKELPDSQDPGVYILAYTNKKLENADIKIEDIFYVGMSNSLGGVKQRLGQFINGIEKNIGHSAGMRFFKEYMKNSSFSKSKQKMNFFVASLSIPCEVSKDKRTSSDLLAMGEVAKFEYSVLAHIKEKLGKEPMLNKK